MDPEYDMGITGGLKIAHLGEAFGIDEVHACGPAHRHIMSAMRNSNFYEVALVGPTAQTLSHQCICVVTQISWIVLIVTDLSQCPRDRV